MGNFSQYMYTNARYATSHDQHSELANTIQWGRKKHFQIIENSMPLTFGQYLFLVTKKREIQKWDCEQWKKIWTFRPGEAKTPKDTGIIGLYGDAVLAYGANKLFAISKDDGHQLWEKDFPYSFYPWHTLILGHTLIVIGVNPNIQSIVLQINLETQAFDSITRDQLLMPEFLLATTNLNDSFLVGHNNNSITAFLELVDAKTLKTIWSKDFSREGEYKDMSGKAKSAYWMGRALCYQDTVIASIFGKKILGIDSYSGQKKWEIKLQDTFTHTFTIDQDYIFLIDDLQLKKIDPNSGVVLNSQSLEGWKDTFTFLQKTILTNSGHMGACSAQARISIFDLSTGDLLQTLEPGFELDAGSPILTDHLLINYNTFSGDLEVTPFKR